MNLGSGSLGQNIIQMDFADDTDDFSEDVLFEKHYAILKKLRGDSMGYDNDYMKSVYRYLHNLYTRWKKPELALEYRNKYLGI